MMKEQSMSDETAMGQVIQIDEARIRDHLGEMVRGTVEETLNVLLDAEADRMCGAGRYERSEARQDTKAGIYERTPQTRAGAVNLKVPKLRRQTFVTAIIERYRQRESSVEEALIDCIWLGFHEKPARADHARDLTPNPHRRGIPGWPILPQPGNSSTALYRWIGIVDQALTCNLSCKSKSQKLEPSLDQMC
jgi:hypothetical protein